MNYRTHKFRLLAFIIPALLELSIQSMGRSNTSLKKDTLTLDKKTSSDFPELKGLYNREELPCSQAFLNKPFIIMMYLHHLPHDIKRSIFQLYLRSILNSNFELSKALEGPTETIDAIAFSPNDQTIHTRSWDNTACLCDLKGNCLAILPGHKRPIISVAFSPDGKTILTGSDDKTARLWDLSGNCLAILKGHTKPIISLAFSPDGKIILTGSDDTTACLWDLTGNCLAILKGHTKDINAVAFSPDGKTILTGSDDTTARLWDLSGNCLATLKGHTKDINAVAFSPDGKTILTGSDDTTACLWDLSGNCLATLKGHTNPIRSLAFSPDGRTIFTRSDDTTACLWSSIPPKGVQDWISYEMNCLQALFIDKAVQEKKEHGSYTLINNSLEYKLYNAMPDCIQSYLKLWYSIIIQEAI